MICRKCGETAIKHDTVKYKENGGAKVVGYHHYCSKCDWEYERKR